MTRWLAEWRSLAPLSRVGVLVLVVGAAADVLAHLSAGSWDGAIGFTPAQHSAHLVVLIGMLFTLLGVVVNGIWPARPRQSLRK